MPLSINTYETAMSNNLTKRDIVIKIFTEKGYPQKHIRDSVQMTLDAISEALLAGRDVELRNFGVFQVQVRKSRVGRNPNRPETDVIIPKRAVIKLKAKLKSYDVEKPSQDKPQA
jgi:nucleoid DNA-binding protein